MSEKTWERNTSGMVSHAHRRREEKRTRVEEIIAQLLRQQQPINFNSVAKAAGVSKAYLYSQTDIRERIEALRQQAMEQAVRERAARPTPSKTDASKDLVILAKDRRIKELEAENRQLKKQLQVALSKTYERL
jgi:hypothetical protein